MPTKKPRVQVTLDPETHEVIERFAALQGRTRGAVISELLDSVRPSLGRTVALLEAAMESPEHVKRGLRGVVEQLQGELTTAAGEGSQQLDFVMQQIEQAEANEGANPHVVTRGSGLAAGTGSASGTEQKTSRKTKG